MENLINGKTYPLWQQFVDKKSEWINGTLEDFPDRIDRMLGARKSEKTLIEENFGSNVMFNILDIPELIKALQKISGKQSQNRSDYSFETGV